MSSTPLLEVDKPCSDSVLWATHRLEEAGYQAVQTFDLQVSRLTHFECPCPHHGTEKCDCQMVVLLIYKKKRKPVTMIIHGYEQTSCFYLVSTPQQPVDQRLKKTIQEVLKIEQFVAPVILLKKTTS